MRAGWWLLGWVGCNAAEVVQFDDEGTVCLGDVYGDDVYADLASVVVVTFDGCATGCADALETSCSVDVDGQTVTVSASGSYEIPNQDTCPSACVLVSAQCALPPLPAGAYTLVYGEDMVAFEVPTTAGPPVCTSG